MHGSLANPFIDKTRLQSKRTKHQPLAESIFSFGVGRFNLIMFLIPETFMCCAISDFD